jgi:hypothetical protein
MVTEMVLLDSADTKAVRIATDLLPVHFTALFI